MFRSINFLFIFATFILFLTPYRAYSYATYYAGNYYNDAHYVDVTGDGIQDLVLQGSCPAADSSIGYNNCFYLAIAVVPAGKGAAYAQFQTYPKLIVKHKGSFQSGRAQFADINADGKRDLIYQGICSSTDDNCFYISVSNSTSTGYASFSAPKLIANHGGSFQVGRAQLADVNGDGRTDLIYQNTCPAADANVGINNCFWVSLLNGTATSYNQSLWTKFPGSFSTVQAEYAKMNSGSKADLILRTTCPSADALKGYKLCIYVSLSTGSSFYTSTIWAKLNDLYSPYFLRIVDINRDGQADLLYLNYYDQYNLRLSTGTTFSAPQVYDDGYLYF